MRLMIAAALLLMGSLTPAGAFFFPERPQTAPWCFNAVFGNTVDCAFFSLEECEAMRSGVGGYCYENPRAAYGERRRAKRRGL
jgi:hypothetical protein